MFLRTCLLKNNNCNILCLLHSQLRFNRTRGLSKISNVGSNIPLSKIKDDYEENKIQGKEKFHEIYRFPYIHWGYILHKLKWHQTLATAVVPPVTGLLVFFNIINTEWLVISTLSCVVLMTNLYGYSWFFYQAVGIIYLSDDGSTVKISYLDFWGNRVNEQYPLEDIMPLADMPSTHFDKLFRSIIIYSTDKVKPKLYLTIGKVTDKERFIKVFGSYNS